MTNHKNKSLFIDFHVNLESRTRARFSMLHLILISQLNDRLPEIEFCVSISHTFIDNLEIDFREIFFPEEEPFGKWNETELKVLPELIFES